MEFDDDILNTFNKMYQIQESVLTLLRYLLSLNDILYKRAVWDPLSRNLLLFPSSTYAFT